MIQNPVPEPDSHRRLFDDLGQGFISVTRFREILIEIDEEISEEELAGIISDVRSDQLFQIDEDTISD